MEEPHTTTPHSDKPRGIVAEFFLGLLKNALLLIIAFVVGTAAGAIVCWYYDIPLVFSVLGGILVLALAVAFMSDGVFS